MTDSASIGSNGYSSRYHTLCFIANILRRIDIEIENLKNKKDNVGD